MQFKAGREAGRLHSPLPRCLKNSSPNLGQPASSPAHTVILQFACICVLLKAFTFRCPPEPFRLGREKLSLIAFRMQPQDIRFHLWNCWGSRIVCVCLFLIKKKKPTWYFFTLCLKRHGLWAVQEDRVRLYCILMPAHVSIPLPSSVSQMLPTGRAQMQRQIGDLRERTGHWTGVTLSLNVSKCLPSLLLLILSSEESPNISEASLMEFFAIAAIFLSICSPPPNRESKDFALKWNRTELFPVI